MQDLQQIFNDLQTVKKEIKEIKEEYKDILTQDEEYKILSEKMNILKEQKKQHEFSAQGDMGMRWERLEELKNEEKSLKEMISDISLSTLMNGETVEVRDEYDNLYTPNYNITFKKAN